MTENVYNPSDIISFLTNFKDVEKKNTFIKEQLKKIDESILGDTLPKNENRSRTIENRIRNYELLNLRKVLVSQLDFNNH